MFNASRRGWLFIAIVLVLVAAAIGVVLSINGGDQGDGAATGEVHADPEPGDAATWTFADGRPPSSADSTLHVLVTRSGCNDGETGRVLRPGIEFTSDTIVLTFTVEAVDPSTKECIENGPVPYEVELGQPLGDRTVVPGYYPRLENARAN